MAGADPSEVGVTGASTGIAATTGTGAGAGLRITFFFLATTFLTTFFLGAAFFFAIFLLDFFAAFFAGFLAAFFAFGFDFLAAFFAFLAIICVEFKRVFSLFVKHQNRIDFLFNA
jgi:hypothetical protein